jgi:hypothetical protein
MEINGLSTKSSRLSDLASKRRAIHTITLYSLADV